MKTQKQQYVTIKGTKNGLTLQLNDDCSFDDLLSGLREVLLLEQYTDGREGHKVNVHIKLGFRYLTEDQEMRLTEAVSENEHLVIHSIESDVMSTEEARRIKAEAEITSVAKIVRSGQVLYVEGDLLLIGDVNPGGTIRAGGNIFVLGSLKGVAHAGCNGNKQAVIAASRMIPTQLRIAQVFNRAPDQKEDGNEMECAYLDIDGNMIIERLQQLAHIRPNLTRLEGGM
ncbi:septum site-determining protein MinC [Bacillus pumilus]|uniref:septum site-determining protein MinC n=1 Tax=Bacillus pumilus TaxID=1408 RepID=UPI003807A914